MIQLKEVTPKNLKAVLDLYETLDDIQKKQVAPNAVSLAQAYLMLHGQELLWMAILLLDLSC